MPGWAEDDPRQFWDAADLYERENSRLYISADFALPRGLDEDEQEELVRSFARELTSQERLPYSVAIHSGRDADGDEHNPHAHLMVAEIADLRERADFGDSVLRRLAKMNLVQRRQFDALLRESSPVERHP
jgi:hypothetical protein